MTVTDRAARYDDPFLNALMYPHQHVARGELWFGGAKLRDIGFISGQVNLDRGATVRRTFTGDIDPREAPNALDSNFSPYGTYVKVLRGIRYPNGEVEEYPIFWGRLDAVEFSRFRVSVRASDAAAQVVDARFEYPYKSTRGMAVVDQMKALITDAIPTATFHVTTTSTQTISTPATWDRERGEALDNLAKSIGCEWHADPDGSFHIGEAPAIMPDEAGSWVVDAGDTGVTVERNTALDRAGVYNAVVVNGEPPDGTPPVYAVKRDDNPNSLVRWGGPFGKVPTFFSSQFITTVAQAEAAAVNQLGEAVSGTRSVRVTCVPNPKLGSSDVVEIITGSPDWDGMYYMQSMTMPIDPENAMTMVCNVALALNAAGHLEPAAIVHPRGYHDGRS